MTNRKRIAFAAVAGWGLVVLSLGTFDIARADHFAVGAQANVRGTDRTTLQARFEWGAAARFRLGLLVAPLSILLPPREPDELRPREFNRDRGDIVR